MSAAEGFIWAAGMFLWILWLAWIIADAIQGTRFGWVMESLWLSIERPIERTIRRITATRKR